jgi:hypothetical protein
MERTNSFFIVLSGAILSDDLIVGLYLFFIRLADTIRKQLKEFVAMLNAIIDVAEGNGQERNDDSPESREARLRATATTIL